MKYFFFDLDGSLMYNPQTKDNEVFIPQVNVEALKKLSKFKHLDFGIASGRIASVSQKILDNHDFNAWIIGENGGTLVNTSGEYMFKKRISPQIYSDLITFAIDNNFHFEAYTDDKIFLNQSEENYSIFLEDIARKMEGILEINYCNEHKYLEDEIENINHFSFVPYENQSNVETIKNFLNKYDNHIDYVHSSIDIIDTTPKNIDKILALKEFLKLNNIDKNDVYYLGDGFNDYETLKYFDNSIVMNHAHETLKKEAKHVVTSASEAIDIFIKETN